LQMLRRAECHAQAADTVKRTLNSSPAVVAAFVG